MAASLIGEQYGYQQSCLQSERRRLFSSDAKTTYI